MQSLDHCLQATTVYFYFGEKEGVENDKHGQLISFLLILHHYRISMVGVNYEDGCFLNPTAIVHNGHAQDKAFCLCREVVLFWKLYIADQIH